MPKSDNNFSGKWVALLGRMWRLCTSATRNRDRDGASQFASSWLSLLPWADRGERHLHSERNRVQGDAAEDGRRNGER